MANGTQMHAISLAVSLACTRPSSQHSRRRTRLERRSTSSLHLTRDAHAFGSFRVEDDTKGTQGYRMAGLKVSSAARSPMFYFRTPDCLIKDLIKALIVGGAKAKNISELAAEEGLSPAISPSTGKSKSFKQSNEQRPERDVSRARFITPFPSWHETRMT